MRLLLAYIKKVGLFTIIAVAVTALFCWFMGKFSLEGFTRGMVIMSVIVFFFGVFALTGAGSATRQDAQQQYVRSAGGTSFDKMSNEYMGPSGKDAATKICLFLCSGLCYVIYWVLKAFLGI